MDALIALVAQNLGPFLAGAASLLLARLAKLVPDVHSPVVDAVDPEVTAFSQWLLKAQAGTIKPDAADIGALKSAKVALDAVLAGK